LPLRVGMGIHARPLLLGRIGYGETVDKAGRHGSTQGMPA